jgi:hypothetical protein
LKSAEELDERWVRNFNATQTRLYLKERAIAYLGGKCQVCGYDKCAAAMDFHHRDPRQKDFHISSKQSWEAIQPELDKCCLLCANCHRETHAGLHPSLIDEPSYEDDAYDLLSSFNA